MIRVFGTTDRDYTSNGDIVIRPLKAIVHKADNADYYLDLETGLEYADYIVSGKIVVADTPQGDQAFRISNPKKTRSKITARAWHVFYDSENYLIADSYVVNKDCGDALDHLNRATEPTSPFVTASDVTTVNSYRCVRKSLYEALQTVTERWGGHLVRDNFTIEVRSAIGADNGVTVQYAKNLRDITCEEDWDNVVTQLMPVGKDGILLDAVDPDASLYVTSDIEYDIPYTKTVSFTQDGVSEDDYKDAEGNLDQAAYDQALVNDLLEQAYQYVNENCVPHVNYTLKANLEKITDIGDVVRVIDSRLGVNIMTNVIAYDYDCILKKYREIEFGNFKQTLAGFASSVNATISSTVSEQVGTVQAVLSQELQQATDQILGVAGESFVIYDGNQILIVDRLPKESAVNAIRLNSAGIGFSSTGANGPFTSAWTIDGTLNMQAINVINLTASLIKGGILKLGAHYDASGVIELYDGKNNLIGRIDSDGLRMYGQDGSYVLMNRDVGFAGFDRNGNKTYWVDGDEFHVRKSAVEDEITICNKLRLVPITRTEGGAVTSDGVGLVSITAGGE